MGDTGHYAALLCSKYKVGIYKDWYLPSLQELNQLLLKSAKIGNLSSTEYWSSEDASTAHAYARGLFSRAKKYTKASRLCACREFFLKALGKGL
jgi:hypothetical protein